MSSPMSPIPLVPSPTDLLAKPPPLGVDGYFAIVILLISLVVMTGDWVGPDLNFLTVMAIYTASRMITVSQAAAGFGNVGLLSVMFLFTVAAGISRTGGMERLIRYAAGNESEHKVLLIRMMVPVIVTSAFLNNTPIVSLLIPLIMSWARRNSKSPKLMLIWLSYSAILGGTCTLIGTSTNLVVVGFQRDAYPDDPSLANPSIFSITPYGVAYAAWGFTFLMLFSKMVMGKSMFESRHEQASELLVGLLVPTGSSIIGQSVAAAGLRHLEGVFLVSITRDGELMHAVGPEVLIAENDILSFAGDLSKIGAVVTQFGLPVVNSERDDSVDTRLGLPPTHTCAVPEAAAPAILLGHGIPRANARGSIGGSSTSAQLGRLPAEEINAVGKMNTTGEPEADLPAQPLRFIRCTLRGSSALVGKTVRDAAFRMRFNAAVVSVHRLPSTQAQQRNTSSSHINMSVQPEASELGSGMIESAQGDHEDGKSAGAKVAKALRPALNLVVPKKGAKEVVPAESRVQVEGKLADIVLMAGDELLLDADVGFKELSSDVSENFEDVRSIIDNTKGFTMAFLACKPLIGSKVYDSGLLGINGVTLTHLDRAGAGGASYQPVPEDILLEEGDVLWFTGDVEGLTFLLSFTGLEHLERGQIAKAGNDDLERRLVQVVVAQHGPLVNRSVRESRFRSKYNAAIVGVHRRGQRLKEKIGDIVLQAGDVLLLDAGNQFLADHGDSASFSLISEVPQSAPMNTSRMWLAIALFTAMISIMIIQAFVTDEAWINLWTASLLLTSIMVLLRCMTWDQAKASFDWTVYLTIASAFGVSACIENTGVAENVAWLFLQPSIAIGGQASILSTLYIVTAMLSEVLTNNAAAALMYPIARIAGDALGVKPELIGYSIMLGASSSFISPFGYQTNLMIYNAGNLRVWDLARIGIPFQLWMWIGATLILGLEKYVSVVAGIMVGTAVALSITVLCLEKLPCAQPYKSAYNTAKGAVGIQVSQAAAVPKEWILKQRETMLLSRAERRDAMSGE